MAKPKLLILGYAQHGKDTFAEMLCNAFELSFRSSSLFAAERVVMPWLAERGVSYSSPEEAYEDRWRHRADWYNAIAEYNLLDPARLGREIFSEYDLYVGLRSLREFQALHEARVFDAAIWVYRPGSPTEPKSSMNLTPNLADFHIHNDSGLSELQLQARWVYHKVLRLGTQSIPREN